MPMVMVIPMVKASFPPFVISDKWADNDGRTEGAQDPKIKDLCAGLRKQGSR